MILLTLLSGGLSAVGIVLKSYVRHMNDLEAQPRESLAERYGLQESDIPN